MVTDNKKKALQCEYCVNNYICKFTEDMKQLSEKVNSLKLSYNEGPFDVGLKCLYFKEKKRTRELDA